MALNQFDQNLTAESLASALVLIRIDVHWGGVVVRRNGQPTKPRLEHVTLTRGQVIYRADQRIDSVYFPEEAVIAMVDRMHDGRTIEVGIIGRDGLVGINIFLGGVVTPRQGRSCSFRAAR